jgi:hypothetical protein
MTHLICDRHQSPLSTLGCGTKHKSERRLSIDERNQMKNEGDIQKRIEAEAVYGGETDITRDTRSLVVSVSHG